jgi:hypothetical protein
MDEPNADELEPCSRGHRLGILNPIASRHGLYHSSTGVLNTGAELSRSPTNWAPRLFL